MLRKLGHTQEEYPMQMKNLKKEIFTIPNLLSLFRLLLIPVYVVIYLNARLPEDYFLAGGILAVSCLTDLVDGKIARRFNMISTVGKVLDPVADKSTQFTLMICLAIRHPLLRWLAVFFFFKELFMLVAGLLFLKKGQILPGALFAGKICTTVLFLSLILMVLMPALNENIVNIIAIVDAGFMVYALISYVLAYYGKNKKLEDV